MFVIQLAINISPRKRKQPTGEVMTLKDFYKLEGVSVVNSFYDPRGMLSPLPIILKVLLRRVFSKKYTLNREDYLVKEIHGQRVDLFRLLVGEVLKFDRSIMPITRNI